MLKLLTTPPKKALNKAFLRERVTYDEITLFKSHFREMLARTETAVAKSEREENMKNIVGDFLKRTWFAGRYEVNTKEDEDLVIHTGKSADHPVGVIFETKKPDSREMLSVHKPNVKALHQLAFYYLRERIEHGNIHAKHLIATDINQWFIFDENLFDKHVFQNPAFRKGYDAYMQSGKSTDFFYKNVAEPAFANLNIEWQCTYFDLRTFRKNLEKDASENDLPLVALFKILSPTNLLKLPFANDSNSLDRHFYTELLHLIGLEEVKGEDSNKKIIRRKAQPDEFSLLENTITKIQVKGLPSNFNAQNSEETFTKQVEAIAFELCITWVNRILFLKLLEAQLVGYHRGDLSFRFLSRTLIRDFDRLHKLFFEVLAEQPNTRRENTTKIFGNVPYLNSSLFEITELERILGINELDDDEPLPICSQTVLKTDKGERRTGSLPTLTYFLEFLDAYDFASEGSEAIQETPRTLINASVLGLIFEKLNGYRDGSFFTPGFVTMYMCRQTIRQAIMDKFNQHFSWSCTDFKELGDRLDSHKKETRAAANGLINALRICDPAVGSGHFLVSVLNELIAIKSELGILSFGDGGRVKGYSFNIENDELFITDEETGEPFRYALNEKNQPMADRQRLQEALFHEKQTLIENCLFGVDINPNSVKICRLRLWIELLKNSYYTVDSNYHDLETLPNIDINIKCGDSLVNRFPLNDELLVKDKRVFLKKYSDDVRAYKTENNKATKAKLETAIAAAKANIRTTISQKSKEYKDLIKFKQEYLLKYDSNSLFDDALTKDQRADKLKLEQEIKGLVTQIESIRLQVIFKNAFEWRFEFPEVLDGDGAFIGFDVVLGNPPYGNIESENLKTYFQTTFSSVEGRPDLFELFIEKGLSITKVGGQLTFILPNTLLSNLYSKKLRGLLLKNYSVTEITNFGMDVFEIPTVHTCIIKVKNKIGPSIVGIRQKVMQTRELKYGFDMELVQSEFESNPNFNFDISFSHAERALFNRLKTLPRFSDKCFIRQCIKTGNDDEFVRKSSETLPEVWKKSLRGRGINRYSTLESDVFIKYGSWLARNWANKDFYERNKIAIRETGSRITATIDFENRYFLSSLYAVYPKDSYTDNYLLFLLGLLNSSFATFVLTKISFDLTEGAFTKMRTNQLGQLPLPLENMKGEEEISALVTQILAAKKADPSADISAWEREVDKLVYGLYGLTEKEIELIEKP